MSGLARAVKRNGLRVQYDKFNTQFQSEKRFQRKMLAGDAEYQSLLSQLDKFDPERPLSAALELEKKIVEREKVVLDSHPRLGKKPPFGAWMKAMEKAKAQLLAERAKKLEESATVPDLDWKEEEG